MNVLSLFDGLSGAQIALNSENVKYNNYFACEIDKHAIKIAAKNYPNTKQLGIVENWKSWELPKIDLMIAGFPCTSLSAAARQKESGLKKGASTLFWDLLAIYNFYKPKYFLFENVASMKHSDRDIITRAIGVEPITINSLLVSAQMRKRIYWTNIPFESLPTNKNILLVDIIENGYSEKDKSYCVTATYARACEKDYIDYSQRQLIFADEKACLLAYERKGRPKLATIKKNEYNSSGIRKLTPIECERLQTIPDNYTLGVSNTQRYKMIGNGFTIDVIRHLLRGLK